MPIALLALTLSAFAIGTTEFVIVGLLPTVACLAKLNESAMHRWGRSPCSACQRVTLVV